MIKVKFFEGSTYKGCRHFATIGQAQECMDNYGSHFRFECETVLPEPRILSSGSLQKMFPRKYKLVRACLCAECGRFPQPESFRTDKDIHEYELSGLCQKCIDEFFGDPE